VGLFNILEEKDLQIRGFNLRIPLDVVLVFTANPEDYTNRGNIITPLKDRIDSQILTHYPRSMDDAIRITEQEAHIVRDGKEIRIPRFFKEIIEQVAFEARKSEFVDQKSGVSARLTIAAMENLVSNAERRAILNGESVAVPRMCDLPHVLPGLTGKTSWSSRASRKEASKLAKLLWAKPCGRSSNDTSPTPSASVHARHRSRGQGIRSAMTANMRRSLPGSRRGTGLKWVMTCLQRSIARSCRRSKACRISSGSTWMGSIHRTNCRSSWSSSRWAPPEFLHAATKRIIQRHARIWWKHLPSRQAAGGGRVAAMRFLYGPWRPESSTDEQRLQQLLSLFSTLVTHTNGDVEEALEWLKQLGEEYGLFDEDMSLEDLINKLREMGLIGASGYESPRLASAASGRTRCTKSSPP
jgi:hypothetical protein